MMCCACKLAVMEIEFKEGISIGIKCPKCDHTISQEKVMEMERGD